MLVLLVQLCKYRLVQYSAQASFHSGPVHKPGVCKVSVCVGDAWILS